MQTEFEWPTISEKTDGLELSVVEEDQIFVIENFLTASECKQFITFIDRTPLELTPPPKRGEATRVNQRTSIQSQAFADTLFTVLKPHLPDLPSFQKHLTPKPTPVSCNPNIRLYKYEKGQYFGPHYDDSVTGPPLAIEPPAGPLVNDSQREPASGASIESKPKAKLPKNKKKASSASVRRTTPTWSEWTILIYLSGHEDGIVGGETVFYAEEGKGKSKQQREIVPPLARGSVLFHRHGKECLLHEGRLVQQGTKYVLRSDLMFARL